MHHLQLFVFLSFSQLFFAASLPPAEGHFKAHAATQITPSSATMSHRLRLSSADSGNSVANLMPPPAASLTRQLAVKRARRQPRKPKERCLVNPSNVNSLLPSWHIYTDIQIYRYIYVCDLTAVQIRIVTVVPMREIWQRVIQLINAAASTKLFSST